MIGNLSYSCIISLKGMYNENQGKRETNFESLNDNTDF